MTTTPGLVDVHAHFLTENYVTEAAAAGHVHPDGMPGWPTWNADEHLRLMDRWGIDRSVLSISSPGTHFGDDEAARKLTRHVNEAGAAAVRAHPDRFGHFASLSLPDVHAALIQVAYALDELGSDGVVVESNSDGTYLGDSRYEPLYSDLNQRKAIVFIHPTSPPSAPQIALGRPRPMVEFIFETARTVTDLLLTDTFLRYPDIRWVISHGGGALPLLADRMPGVPDADVDSRDAPPRRVRSRRTPATGRAVVRHGRHSLPEPDPHPGAHVRIGPRGLRQ